MKFKITDPHGFVHFILIEKGAVYGHENMAHFVDCSHQERMNFIMKVLSEIYTQATRKVFNGHEQGYDWTIDEAN